MGGSLGSGLWQAICQFIQSPIIAFAAAVAIIALALLLMLNEGKGLGSWVIRIAVGIAIILGISTIIGWFPGLHGAVGC